MQQILFSFLFLFSITNASGQLAAHYQFEQDGRALSLEEKMDSEGVPGFSTYLIYGEQRDSLALGTLRQGGLQKVMATTPFPAGAMSEAPVLFELLRLSDSGEIHLDEPVEKYLPELRDKRWLKFKPVTIRDLILRRRNLSGPMKPAGFAAGEQRPELARLLKAGNASITDGLFIRGNLNFRQQAQCGNAILLQLILEKYYGKPLPEIMKERVLKPLGMDHSFYAAELSPEQEKVAAMGHDKSGAPLPGGYRRYTELAAMGLWTTPRDYALLVRHIIRAAKGKDNRFLKRETAHAGLTRQSGYRSLLFHIDDNGGIYWGGNAKGYFTAMQANLDEDYIMVAFCNEDLNWPLVMGCLYQSGGWIATQRKGEQLVLFTQPGDEALSEGLKQKLNAYARENQVAFTELDASDGAPAIITATPALLYQSPEGQSLCGGKIKSWEAVENFLRTARTRQAELAVAETGPILVRREGRQNIGFPLKWTEWGGEAQAGDWQGEMSAALEKALGAEYQTSAGFSPTCRRFYLDVHPYATTDSIFLSLAVFSQFDCIHPVFDNFGKPLSGATADREKLLSRAAEIFAGVVRARLSDVEAGDALFPLAETVPVVSLEALGLPLPESKLPVDRKDQTPLSSTGLSGKWKHLAPAGEGLPLLQFNFPSPLDRYAGEVRRLEGVLAYEEGKLSGEFVAALKSLTMGMKELDAKVLKQYLEVSKYAQAAFSFEEQDIALQWDRPTEATIRGTFHFLGREIPLAVNARLEPHSANRAIGVEVHFGLDISDPFGLPGPDGPGPARKNLEFNLHFQMKG